MLIKFAYKNHKGRVFCFGEGVVLANRHELYDYAWDSTIVGSRVGRLERSTAPRSVPLIFVAASADAVDAALDELIDLAESDVTANQSGVIIINGYQYRCFVVAAKHGEWLPKSGYCEVTLTVQPDGGVWTKELPAKPFNDPAASVILEGDDNLAQPLKAYAYEEAAEPDYTCLIYGREPQSGQIVDQNNVSYTYAEGSEHTQIEVNTPCKMRLSIYGPVTLTDTITIQIGSNTYLFGGPGCSVTLDAGKVLILDQQRQTIEIEDANGVRTNAFCVWMTVEDNDLFAPLEPGVHDIVWSGFSFYLTLIEERSAPRWL